MIDAVAVIAAIGSLLGTITAAGIRKVWVWGWVYEAKAKESDFWRDAFLKATAAKEEQLARIDSKVPGG